MCRIPDIGFYDLDPWSVAFPAFIDGPQGVSATMFFATPEKI
jgi:hypothetical protein